MHVCYVSETAILVRVHQENLSPADVLCDALRSSASVVKRRRSAGLRAMEVPVRISLFPSVWRGTGFSAGASGPLIPSAAISDRLENYQEGLDEAVRGLRENNPRFKDLSPHPRAKTALQPRWQ
jgi:hypothetical protein